MTTSTLLFILKTPEFSHFVTHFGYFGILIWFVTFDQLTPLPEEVSLLVIGYLSAHHVFNPFIAGVFSLAGFLTIDVIYFFLSHKGSSMIKRKTQGSSALMTSFKKKLKANTPRAIIVLCFIPRMRLFVPILAGSIKIPFKKFLLYDSIGLILFTTIYLVLGIIFNKSLESLISKTKGLQNIVFFSAVFVIAVTILLLMRKRNTKSAEA